LASPEQKPVSLAGDENFRVLVETIDDIIVIGDLEGRILYANPATTAVLGYTPQELAGMMVLDLNAASVREEAAAILNGDVPGHAPVLPVAAAAQERLAGAGGDACLDGAVERVPTASSGCARTCRRSRRRCRSSTGSSA
jgi:PAS domain-containing protein